MIRVNEFVIIESREDFEENIHPYRRDLLDSAVLPSSFKIEKANFPIAFELSPSWDAYFLDSWYEVDYEEAKSKITKALIEEIERRKKIIKKLAETSWQIEGFVI